MKTYLSTCLCVCLASAAMAFAAVQDASQAGDMTVANGRNPAAEQSLPTRTDMGQAVPDETGGTLSKQQRPAVGPVAPSGDPLAGCGTFFYNSGDAPDTLSGRTVGGSSNWQVYQPFQLNANWNICALGLDGWYISGSPRSFRVTIYTGQAGNPTLPNLTDAVMSGTMELDPASGSVHWIDISTPAECLEADTPYVLEATRTSGDHWSAVYTVPGGGAPSYSIRDGDFSNRFAADPIALRMQGDPCQTCAPQFYNSGSAQSTGSGRTVGASDNWQVYQPFSTALNTEICAISLDGWYVAGTPRTFRVTIYPAQAGDPTLPDLSNPITSGDIALNGSSGAIHWVEIAVPPACLEGRAPYVLEAKRTGRNSDHWSAIYLAPNGQPSYSIMNGDFGNRFAADPIALRMRGGDGCDIPCLDTTPPVVEVDEPNALACACDLVDIIGSVDDPDGNYIGDSLQYRRSDVASWTTADTALGARSGTLYTWDTSALGQGFYFLRVVGTNECGLSDSDSTFVYVSKSFGSLELRSPADGAIVGRTVCFDGTASTQSCFDHYTVMYRPAGGGAWQPVDPGNPIYTSTVINDGLATWDSNTVADGDYQVRLQGFDDCGNFDTVIHTVTIDNTAPVSLITSPIDCDYVDGVVPVIGTANDANLASWTLQYTGGNTNGWITISSGNTPVVNGLLGNWDTTNLPICAYTLRLIVVDQSVLNCNGSSRNRTDYLVSVNVGELCDINGDGAVNAFDIEPFLNCLFP